MTREELIEEAAAAIFDAADLQLAPDDQMWELARRDARAVLAVFEKAQAPTTNYIDIVFDGPPEAEAGRFVEVEDATGASVKFGEWVEREDGYWVLRIEASAQAPTDEERHWSDAAASAYPGDEYDNADLRTAFGRGVKWERRRPAQTEPTPFNGKWVCGKCAREVAQGVDDGQIPEHHRTCPKRAQIEPTDDERGALPIAPRETWGWDTCVVCGSKEVSDRGMVIMGASKGAPYVARIAWCDQSQECREDLRQTSFLLTEFDANMIDQPEGGEGVTRPAQTEPTAIQFVARRSGKSQALIDSMLAQANEHGIRVEVVYTQTEPTDAQVKAGVRALYEYTGLEMYPDEMRASLKAAFTAGQEDKL